MNQWEVIVGNIGRVWHGTNGAQAYREYGQWKAKSLADDGRAGGESVTLIRSTANSCSTVREHPGHVWFLYRLGDGNEGNYPRFYVRVLNDQNPFNYLAACIANRYIVGSATRRYIVKNLQIDGEPEYGLNAWVHEGPKGEQAFGAAWITAEFERASVADVVRSSLHAFTNPRDHLDLSARRMLKGY